mgnify:FL=1
MQRNSGSSDLVTVVGEASVGDVLKLEVYRSGSTVEIEVTVGESVQSALAQEQTEQETQSEQGGQYGQQYGGQYGGYGEFGIPGFGGFGG